MNRRQQTAFSGGCGVAKVQSPDSMTGVFDMRGLAFALALFAVSQLGFAGEAGKKKDLPKPLPDDVVKAWKDAGATVGWMKEDENGILRFLEKAEPGALPAFQLGEWKDGLVGKLPLPKAAFGLYLAKTDIMDGSLKELANLHTLGSLCLCETPTSGAAVEALRKALPKCFIFHC
jgi:hypothetical protein